MWYSARRWAGRPVLTRPYCFSWSPPVLHPHALAPPMNLDYRCCKSPSAYIVEVPGFDPLANHSTNAAPPQVQIIFATILRRVVLPLRRSVMFLDNILEKAKEDSKVQLKNAWNQVATAVFSKRPISIFGGNNSVTAPIILIVKRARARATCNTIERLAPKKGANVNKISK